MPTSLFTLLLGAGTTLLAIAFLMPGHYLPWASCQTQWVSALALCLVAASVSTLPLPERRLPIPRLAWLALGLVVVPLLQLAAGMLPFHSDAVLASLYLLALALCIVAGATPEPARARQILRWLSSAFVASGAVSVALALVQWLQLGSSAFIADLPPGGRPFANLAQPNHLATLLSLGVVSLLYLYQLRLLGASACGLLLVLLGFGLVMTQSRTGWLSMALLAVWCLALGRRSGMRVGRAATLASAALFAAGIAAWEPLNRLLQFGAAAADRLTPGTRWLHWRTLWEAVWLEPWTGYGWQQVALAQQRTAVNYPASAEMLQNSHNVLLDLLIWNGVPIGVVVMVSVVWWFVNRVRRCAEPETFVLIAAFGVLGTHALLEFPLDYSYFLLPFGLIIGLLDAPPRRPPVLPRPVFLTLLAGMLPMLLWIGVEYLKIEQANRDVRLMLAGYGLDKVSQVPAPEVRLLDGPREYHRFMISTARPDMSDDELEWMRHVVARNAYPPALLRFALAAGLNGRTEEAALTLKLLCRIHPTERCAEARAAWLAAQEQSPDLLSVPAP